MVQTVLACYHGKHGQGWEVAEPLNLDAMRQEETLICTFLGGELGLMDIPHLLDPLL